MKLGIWLISAAFATQAQAQSIPATDTDLHAAYCLEESKYEVKTYQAAAAETAPNVPPHITASLQVAQANLRKFQMYILPRVQYVDATQLLSAASVARSDLERALTSPPDLKALQAKFALCRDTSTWLPF
jgi:hypothetical protein